MSDFPAAQTKAASPHNPCYRHRPIARGQAAFGASLRRAQCPERGRKRSTGQLITAPPTTRKLLPITPRRNLQANSGGWSGWGASPTGSRFGRSGQVTRSRRRRFKNRRSEAAIVSLNYFRGESRLGVRSFMTMRCGRRLGTPVAPAGKASTMCCKSPRHLGIPAL